MDRGAQGHLNIGVGQRIQKLDKTDRRVVLFIPDSGDSSFQVSAFTDIEERECLVCTDPIQSGLIVFCERLGIVYR